MSWFGWSSANQQGDWDPLQGSQSPMMTRNVHVAESFALQPSEMQSAPPSTPVRVTPAPSAFETPARTVPEEGLEEFQQFSLLIDYKLLVHRLPAGMHISPSERDDTWSGIVFMRQGMFSGGVFRFSMQLAAYPLAEPRIVFSTRLFHPLVHPVTGELAPLVADWKPQSNRVWHALQALHEALLSPSNVAEPLNEDAQTLLEETPETFAQFANQCCKESLLAAESVSF